MVPGKYLVCNADEGDPGAYMNRNEIESDPHALIEGMILGAYVMGASEGIMYVRAEYPLAVQRFNKRRAGPRERGLLGRTSGSSFSFDLSYVEGAGAFVCGEETALDRVDRRTRRAAYPPATLPCTEGALGQTHQHQQRRDLDQRPRDRHHRW